MNQFEIHDLEALPYWVWGLLDALDKYENEHGSLYRMTDDAKYERAPCFGSFVKQVIPPAVTAVASLLRSQRETA